VEFDIEKDDILKVLEHSFMTDEFKPAIAEVRQNCFYHLDGRATKRAADFIREIRQNR
jgi:hypothetical protein